MKQHTKLWATLMSSRPISWINTAYPFLAGYIITSHELTTFAVIATIYFLIPYNLLMYGINDVFDYESDLRNPRKGGIEGLKLQRSLHPLIIAVAVTANLPFLAYLLIQGSLAANITLLFVVFMVIAYSVPKLRFKERPVLDSATSSIHFVGPLVYALVFVGWHNSYLPYILAFFTWGMASHAFGAVQDIVADRHAHIASIATKLGAHKTIIFSAILYATTALLLTSTGWTGFAVGLVALLYLQNVLRFWRITDARAEETHAGWRRFLVLNWVAGAIITIALILSYSP